MYNTEYMQQLLKIDGLIQASIFAASVLYCHRVEQSELIAFEKLKEALDALGIEFETEAMKKHKQWLESRHAT